MKDVTEKLKEYIRRKNLRWTGQRQTIVEQLLRTRQHLTTDELFRKVQKQDPSIGYATVARTLHFLVDAGFCDQVDISDGSMRYEVVWGHEHHDHLICSVCGKFIEIFSPELEKIQAKLVRQHGFIETTHKLQIFGTCIDCQKNLCRTENKPLAK
ncbi:MAG: transcriptional repressor [Phycisphaerae bacterium]|nr:transcriptional repressor [Phycisphaerae bacterium]